MLPASGIARRATTTRASALSLGYPATLTRCRAPSRTTSPPGRVTRIVAPTATGSNALFCATRVTTTSQSVNTPQPSAVRRGINAPTRPSTIATAGSPSNGTAPYGDAARGAAPSTATARAGPRRRLHQARPARRSSRIPTDTTTVPLPSMCLRVDAEW